MWHCLSLWLSRVSLQSVRHLPEARLLTFDSSFQNQICDWASTSWDFGKTHWQGMGLGRVCYTHLSLKNTSKIGLLKYIKIPRGLNQMMLPGHLPWLSLLHLRHRSGVTHWWICFVRQVWQDDVRPWWINRSQGQVASIADKSMKPTNYQYIQITCKIFICYIYIYMYVYLLRLIPKK